MTSSNPVITHLQQNSSRISRMLALGRTSTPTPGSEAFSTIASDFGGRKFQLAAQKMRILDVQKMGRSLPGQGQPSQLGTEIQARFSQSAELLHISTKPAGTTNIWSPVNMIYPRGNSVEKPQIPDEPGTFRQGSVIPKLSTFPKPGQSLESFKEQVNQKPAVRKPARETQQPVRLDPRDRLYSRVQEITPGSKDSGNPKTTDSDAETPSQASPATTNTTIQRQVEPSILRSETAQSEPKSRFEKPVEKPTGIDQHRDVETAPGRTDKPVQPAPEPKSISATALPSVTGSSINQGTPVSPEPQHAPSGEAKTNSNESKLPLARPVQTVQPQQPAATLPIKPALAVAKPIQKLSQQKAEPAVLPLVKPIVRPASSAKSLPIASPKQPGDSPRSSGTSQPTRATQTVIQRQKDTNTAPSKTQQAKPQEKVHPEIGDTSQSAQADAVHPEKFVTPQIPAFGEPSQVDQNSQASDQPMQKRFEYRRLASSQLKSLRPAESLLAPHNNPLINRTVQPLISARKYFANAQVTPVSAEQRPLLNTPAAANLPQQAAPFSAAMQPEAMRATDKLEPPVSQVPLRMDLARISKKTEDDRHGSPRQATQSISRRPAQPELAHQSPAAVSTTFPAPTNNVPKPPGIAEPVSSDHASTSSDRKWAIQKNGPQNVVQRQWEEHDDIENSQSQPGPSMEELAEKILPLVKRILAIESERSGSLFR